MMHLSQAARAIGAQMHGRDQAFSGVSIDSRNIKPGDLFIALHGEHFDGHEFAAQALAQGAVGVVAHRDVPVEGCVLRVADTRLALGELAAYWRSQFVVPLVAITGSNGKTTVKEMLASILRKDCDDDAEVLATQGNLNNDVGVPLTLLQLRVAHRYAVIEMGMNHPGEIAYLTRIAQPTVALVNNAAAAHLAGLGSVEAVARAKGEIFEGLKPNGTAVINGDDVHAPLWRKLAGERRTLEFGFQPSAAVTARYALQAYGSALRLITPQGEAQIELQVPGEHNVRNALAAVAAASALGVEIGIIAAGLERFAGVKGRLQRKAGMHGVTVIDDTYNANPDSVQAAINVLAKTVGRKILVLGDMGELGEEGEALHVAIGETAYRAGVDELYTLGELSASAARRFGARAHPYREPGTLLDELRAALRPGDTVLVKGSRFMRMERVVDALTAVEHA
ncbi:MAG: UDP-N-acetylmuramoyl-tripeptide--D-alanyl-D-alanine ligase [Pseudomonadota bacterium]